MWSLEWILTACLICFFWEMNEHEWTPLSFLVEPVYFFTPFRRNNGKSFFKWLRFNCAEKFGKEFGAGLVGCSFHRSGWFLDPHFSQNPQEFIFWAEREQFHSCLLSCFASTDVCFAQNWTLTDSKWQWWSIHIEFQKKRWIKRRLILCQPLVTCVFLPTTCI